MQAIQKSSHYIIATFLALFVGYFFMQNTDTNLVEPNAILGIATFDLVNVSLRIRNFYLLLLFTGITFLVFSMIFSKWNKLSLHKWTLPLSVIGIMTLLNSFYNPNNVSVSIFILGVMLTNTISIKEESNRLFYVLLSVSITVFVSYFVRISGMEFNSGFVAFLWICILLVLYFIDNKTSLHTHTKKLFPFLILPLLEPLGSEIFLILNQRGFFITTPIGWVLLFFILLLLWVLIRYKKTQDSSSLTNSKFTYLFVFSLATFSLYQPYFSFWGDLFELANPANAMMRHFKFDELPFIDYFSSHVLFEQIPQWVYVILNGYSADVGFMIYSSIVSIIGILISFWFFKRMLNTYWALLIVFLFPFTDVLIPPTFVYALLTIKLLFNYFNDRKVSGLYYLLLWVLFITIWRIDFGASIIPALVLIFGLDWLQQKQWPETRKVIIHVGLFTLTIIGITFIVDIINDGKLFSNLPLALEYLGASQAHAYSELTKQYNTLFYLHYYVFPIVAVIILIQTWISKWEMDSRYSFNELATVFLGLIYLFNAQRGLVRHSFSEEYDLYISSVFFLFLASWTLRFYTNNRGLIFTTFSFLIILGFHFSNHSKPLSFGAVAVQNSIKSASIPNTKERINRVQISKDFDEEGYKQLAKFINDQLDPDQTFLDLSHTPMLYFLTQRKVPSYFNQYIQNTVTPELLKQNVSNLENIGLVVFGHSPRNLIDALDGVPNELRYLPITEYIYENFTPFKVVNGYRIWMPNEDKLSMVDSTQMLPIMHDNLRSWASYLGRTGNFENTSEVVISGNELILMGHTPSLNDAFEVEFELIPSGVQHTSWIQYFDLQDQLLGQIQFQLFETNENARFIAPIGYQYSWLSQPISKIEFNYPEYLTIKSIKLVTYEP